MAKNEPTSPTPSDPGLRGQNSPHNPGAPVPSSSLDKTTAKYLEDQLKGVKPAELNEAPDFSLKRILVPIDFSDSARRALYYAGALAARFDARILPLHVVEPIIYPSDMAFAPMAAEMPTKVSVDATQGKLQEWCEAVLPAGALEKPLIRIGQPFHEIAMAAQELRVDLIVISTHGYTGFKHVLLGSTAERVVRHAPCPVLTVRRS
jgi:universal stress protein A